MITISYETLRSYISQNLIQPAFQTYIKGFSSSILVFQNMSQEKLRVKTFSINSQIDKKDQQQARSDSLKNPRWKRGELKLFTWFVLFYSFTTKIEVFDLKDKDFLFFQTIFIRHSVQKLRFQVMGLFPSKGIQKKGWQEDQKKLLQMIINRTIQAGLQIEWKAVSFQIYEHTLGRSFKNFKSCREMWLNHLKPELTKKVWSSEETLRLLELVQQYGSQWSMISKKFDGTRNEHMIKNQYRSQLSKQMKKHPEKTQQQILSRLIKIFQAKRSKVSSVLFPVRLPQIQVRQAYTQTQTVENKKQQNVVKTEPETIIEPENEENRPMVQDKVSSPSWSLKEQPMMLELQEFGNFRFENIELDYHKIELQQTFDDVLPKLGYSCPEQLDYLFQSDPEPYFDSLSLSF